MADLKDPSQPPRKHKVINWNPVEEERSANNKPAVAAYLSGAVIALVVVLIATGTYFLFFNNAAGLGAAASGSGATSAEENIRRAFESVSRAQGVRDATERKLDAARQMPTTGHEVLRQMLINIEKEKIEADNYMRDSSYARAIAEYKQVDTLVDEFTLEVDNKQKARNLYDTFLVKSGELERGKHLNPEAFEEAFYAASEGKSFLDLGSFSPALQRLEVATAKLNAVETSINDFIRSNAALGYRFIALGKKDQAIEAFTNVLELDPGNEEALQLLERAKVADKSFVALQAAQASEEANELEEALVSFEQAFSIDSGSATAQSGISRVRRKIAERDFTNYFTLAQRAINDARYEEAIENFQAALEIFPQRSDIEQAISRARAEKRRNDVVSRVTRAYAFEREYAWPDARDLYQELVNMEPDLQEAKDGLLRTGRMIRSILRYETLLAVATNEARMADFQTAIRTFDEAMKSKPAYLSLTEEGERLRNFLQLQNQPVTVQFISDDSTWVSVQGPSMRKPEKFDELSMDLLPGKYFVIGRKKGYQDVRFGLQIRAGIEQQPLTVICNTKSNY